MQKSDITPQKAKEMLAEGNRRFVSGNPTHPRQGADRRGEVTGGQSPFAIVLSCADSRVMPEVLFDQGIGDLFVIRNAGNILDDVVLGSIEYAVEHLGTPLMFVMGHASCGAVTATVQGGEAPGHIGSIVEAILPAVEQVKDKEGDPINNSIWANVKMVVEQLKKNEPIIAKAVRENHLEVTGGVYQLDTGEVKFL